MASEHTVQINPRIPRALKEQIDALCEERGVLIGEVVTTALRQYFGELETHEDRLAVIEKQLAMVLHALHHVQSQGVSHHQPSPDEEMPAAAWSEDGRVHAPDNGKPRWKIW